MTAADIAELALGIERNRLPTDEDELRAMLIAETVRLGLCHLYQKAGELPVHQTSLRNWVGRKLEAAIPDIFESEHNRDYRDVLLDGGGGNMEFLGDVLTLSEGYVCPAPTRAVDAGGGDFILTSGLPTASLGPAIRQLVKFNFMGRRLTGVSPATLEKETIRIRTADNFLNIARHAPPPRELLQEILRRDPEEWKPDDEWECYQSDVRDAFGFAFQKKAHKFPAGDGHELELWRRPFTRHYAEYWLRDLQEGNRVHRVNRGEWVRACIALDHLNGDPRRATVTERAANGIVQLNFNPWGLVWRWLLLQGARSGEYNYTRRTWHIPAHALPQIKSILERVGMRVLG